MADCEVFDSKSQVTQCVVFSSSSRTMSNGHICEKPQVKRIEFYGSSDKPLGVFVREFLGNAAKRCSRCSELASDHEKRFVHPLGCLTVYSKVLNGTELEGAKEGKIWTWNRCLRCGGPDAVLPARKVLLSEAAQNLSFGLFLRDHLAKQVAAGCGHCAYRDCLLFFAVGNSVGCVLFNAIRLFSSTFPLLQQEYQDEPHGLPRAVPAVYEEEPSSIIAHALMSPHYEVQVAGEELLTPLLGQTPWEYSPVGEILSSSTPLTVKVKFSEYSDGGNTDFKVTCYYARHFVALRERCCGGNIEYVRSLARCEAWDAQGGKSKVYFAKTQDGRFIVKQVTPTEKCSFLSFAPEYFKYLWGAMSMGNPSCLAKILGFYTIAVTKGCCQKKMNVLVMENLLYGRIVSRMYDLKGSLRSRYNSQGIGTLLDQNLLQDMQLSPIFLGRESMLRLKQAVDNDTSFLAQVNVMDYSLLAVVVEDSQELVVGIIDYIRQYTWDKHVETCVKKSGILGGSRNVTPTILPPKEYRKRFRKAISSYFVVVPDPDELNL